MACVGGCKAGKPSGLPPDAGAVPGRPEPDGVARGMDAALAKIVAGMDAGVRLRGGLRYMGG